MEKEELYLVVAKNISDLRRAKGMTQLDLAERIHYSDKTVSKWERAEAIPDMETLLLLADVFGVTVNDIVYKKSTSTPKVTKDKFTWTHFYITLISICVPYLLIALVSLFLGIFAPDFFKVWFVRIIFYGVSASFVVWLVFAVLWWPSLWEQIICSFLVWSVAISINISFKTVGTLLIYGVAIVLQIAIVLWWLLKRAYGIKKEKWRMLPQKRK